MSAFLENSVPCQALETEMLNLPTFASESSRRETKNCLQQYSTVGAQATAMLVFKGKP